MNRRSHKPGFTLVEVLAAATIMVTVVSMVYGSYFATSRSTQSYGARMTTFQNMRELLTVMARQIRCSYREQRSYSAKGARPRNKAKLENVVDYFTGDSGDPSSEVLHLVTTSGNSWSTASQDGIFDVTYKFDKGAGLLSVSRQRFTGVFGITVQKKRWRPIAENVTAFELSFFDGEHWLRKWSFEEQRDLPAAVKIEVTFEDEGGRQHHGQTVAHLYCRNRRIGQTSVSGNEQ
jgi:type II secretion system protein J